MEQKICNQPTYCCHNFSWQKIFLLCQTFTNNTLRDSMHAEKIHKTEYKTETLSQGDLFICHRACLDAFKSK